MGEFDVDTEAMKVALEIQSAYEEEIEQDSETAAFLMQPILAFAHRAIAATEEEDAKSTCELCRIGENKHEGHDGHWWHGYMPCSATEIHERRHRREAGGGEDPS